MLFSHLFNEQRSIVTFAHSLSAVLTVAKIEIKFRRIVCVCAYDWSTVFKIKKNGTNIFCIARVYKMRSFLLLSFPFEISYAEQFG